MAAVSAFSRSDTAGLPAARIPSFEDVSDHSNEAKAADTTRCHPAIVSAMSPCSDLKHLAWTFPAHATHPSGKLQYSRPPVAPAKWLCVRESHLTTLAPVMNNQHPNPMAPNGPSKIIMSEARDGIDLWLTT